VKRLLLIALLGLLLSACGDVSDTNIPTWYIMCVENQAAHGMTASAARDACGEWRP